MSEYEYAPTKEQLARMADVKAAHPEHTWFQVWHVMLIDHGDEFKDNDHDIYVLMNSWPTVEPSIPTEPAKQSPSPSPIPVKATNPSPSPSPSPPVKAK